jgi:hypothetical protein
MALGEHDDVRNLPHVIRRPPGSVLQHGLNAVGHPAAGGQQAGHGTVDWTDLLDPNMD